MVKTIDDYLDKVLEKHSYVPKEELKAVLVHGFYVFDKLAKLGADIGIKNDWYYAWCKWGIADEARAKLYCYRKMRIKLRLLYRYAHKEYDGTYYFGVSEAQWEFINSQGNFNRRCKRNFGPVRLYKIMEECFLDKSKTHFFRLYYPLDLGWAFYKDELISRNYEYIAERDKKGTIIMK